MSTDELFGLSGRTAVVLGASSGLGAECARALASAGANVAVLARRLDKLSALAEELEGQGGRALAIAADATDDDALTEAIGQVESELGPLWAGVNAAGISKLGRFTRHSRQKWDDVIAVNLTAAFVFSQAIANRLVERGDPGRIVNLSSVLGRGASPVHNQVGYTAAKGGVDNLTRQMAVELAPHKITVNAIAPGYFPTELTVAEGSGGFDAQLDAGVKRFTPMGRPGDLSEIRSTLLYFTAPASSYVTGTIAPVDGGWTAW